MTQIFNGGASTEPNSQAAFKPNTAGVKWAVHYPDLDPALNLWPAVVAEVAPSRLVFVEEVVAMIEERVLASVAARVR